MKPTDRTQGIWKWLRKPRMILVSGPCVIESEEMCLEIAATMKAICESHGVAYVFKASFDKANRTSGKSFRGIGIIDALSALARVRDELGVPVMTDIHESEEAGILRDVVDVIQIPALLCRQTDLIEAAVWTGKIVNLKKGQFLAPESMAHVVAKAADSGGTMLLLTERGSCFGYGDTVADMRSIPIMKRNGFPVLFDATHSIQKPGSQGDCSGGQREFSQPLALAAIAAGADGIFVETHPDTDKALSDGPCMMPLIEMPELVRKSADLFEHLRSCETIRS